MRVGTRVGGRYRLIRGPVRGGTGEVWQAHDEELGRDVALKRVLPGSGSAAVVDRLAGEARALARFRHPHVVTLYDVLRLKRWGRTTSWLVMEYVPGGTLDGRPALDPRLAAHVGAQLADALGALHAEGIVHCDVKPGNVIVAGDTTAGGKAAGARTVRLTDLGAAYRVGGKETITPNSSVGYTPGYAAPEVQAGRPPVPASDVHSLGATVYALLARRPPDPPPEPDDPGHGGFLAARRVGAGRAERPVELPMEAGPLRALLEAMLAADPHRRPGVAEVRERFAAIAGPPRELPPFPARNPEPAGPSPVAYRPRRPLGLPSGARPLLLGAAVLAVLALIGWAVLGRLAGGPADRGSAASSAGTPALTRTAGAADTSSVFGDPRTVDPCSLADAAAFGGYGSPQLVTDYGNFDRCDVVLSSADADAVDIEVLLLAEPAPASAAPARTRGQVRVFDEPEETGTCARIVALAGVPDLTVEVSATTLDDAAHPLCAIADAATGVAADRLGQGTRLARRSPAPAGDLVNRRACALPPAAALRTVPGIDTAHPQPGFGDWSCTWQSLADSGYVKLRFDRPSLPGGDGTVAGTVGGHRAVTIPQDDGPDTCSVDVAGPFYTDQDGGRSLETALVTVGGQDSTGQACRLAAGLARAVAPELSP